MMPVDYLMVLVSDMDRSVDFYENKIGLRLLSRSDGWSEFDAGTTRLALHGGGTPPKTSEASSDGERTAGQCSLGFNVTDVDRTYRELRAKGVEFDLPPEDRFQRIRLAVAHDPDGLTLSFRQRLTTPAGAPPPG
ncbi:MAG: VOC family protein [Thermoplasmata archaeon]|nr:VOC family protein [Thermoplasmata archaeon]